MEKRFTLITLVFFIVTGLVNAQNECQVKITYEMNKSLPPSYTFKTDFQTNDAKFYWHFSDGARYEEPSPTHTFKTTGNYVVEVKVADSKGNVCFGRIAGRFEGKDNPATDPALIYAKGYVKNLSGIAGCGLVISTDDGKVLIPVEILPKFELKEGQRIAFAFEYLPNLATICMAGSTVKIHKIEEIRVDQPVLIEASGKVIDLSKVEGCGLVIAISNDKVLVPVEIIPDFELKEGQQVKFVYEPLAILGGVCVEGPLVRIHRIVEVPVTTPILYARGKVVDFSEIAGCGLVVELADGTKLVLVEVLPEIALKDGMIIEFAYEYLPNVSTICMAGKSIRIHRLKVVDLPDPVILSGKGVVKDMSSLAGCGLAIVLENGRTLIPVEFAVDFDLKEGQFVELAYVVLSDRASICMAGTLVKVVKIAEIPIILPILYTATGKVKDMSAIAGCRFVIALESGRSIIPWEILHDFKLSDGQYVGLEFEILANAMSVCDLGSVARIHKIWEIGTTDKCSVELAYKLINQEKKAFGFFARTNVKVTSWQWDFGDGNSSTEAEPEHAFEKAGVYTVTCTIVSAEGCKTSRRITVVVQEPGLPVCQGAINLLLFDPSEGKCDGKAVATLLDGSQNEYKNVVYRWSTGETGNTASNLCADKPYYLHALIDGVCQKNTSFTFLSKPLWRVSADGAKYTFQVTNPLDGVTYIWDLGNGEIVYGPNITYDFDKDGDYNIRLIASYGADSNESEQVIRVQNTVTNIEITEKPSFRVYPNPATGKVWIEADNRFAGTLRVDISDMQGKVVQQRFYNATGNPVEININHLPSGLYILRFTDGRTMNTEKLLVK